MEEYYCSILDIGKTNDITIIRKAYIELARLYHPDKNDSPDAEEILK